MNKALAMLLSLPILLFAAQYSFASEILPSGVPVYQARTLVSVLEKEGTLKSEHVVVEGIARRVQPFRYAPQGNQAKATEALEILLEGGFSAYLPGEEGLRFAKLPLGDKLALYCDELHYSNSRAQGKCQIIDHGERRTCTMCRPTKIPSFWSGSIRPGNDNAS